MEMDLPFGTREIVMKMDQFLAPEITFLDWVFLLTRTVIIMDLTM